MTESYPHVENVDWHYKAANYYHKALSYLRTSLRDKQTRDDLPYTASDAYAGKIEDRYMTGSGNESGLLDEVGVKLKESHDGWDEFLAGTSILSIYECLNLNTDGFSL
jgi:hypothetical protein